MRITTLFTLSLLLATASASLEGRTRHEGSKVRGRSLRALPGHKRQFNIFGGSSDTASPDSSKSSAAATSIGGGGGGGSNVDSSTNAATSSSSDRNPFDMFPTDTKAAASSSSAAAASSSSASSAAAASSSSAAAASSSSGAQTPSKSSSSSSAPSSATQSLSTSTDGTSTVVVTQIVSPTEASTSTAPAASSTSDTSGGDSSNHTPLIIGVSVVGGVAVLGAAIFLYMKFGSKRFAGYDDDDTDIKWPELNRDGDAAAMHPLPARRTGGAGFDMGEEDARDDSSMTQDGIGKRDSFSASTTAFAAAPPAGYPVNDGNGYYEEGPYGAAGVGVPGGGSVGGYYEPYGASNVYGQQHAFYGEQQPYADSTPYLPDQYARGQSPGPGAMSVTDHGTPDTNALHNPYANAAENHGRM